MANNHRLPRDFEVAMFDFNQLNSLWKRTRKAAMLLYAINTLKEFTSFIQDSLTVTNYSNDIILPVKPLEFGFSAQVHGIFLSPRIFREREKLYHCSLWLQDTYLLKDVVCKIPANETTLRKLLTSINYEQTDAENNYVDRGIGPELIETYRFKGERNG